jgi:hypothetical protein
MTVWSKPISAPRSSDELHCVGFLNAKIARRLLLLRPALLDGGDVVDREKVNEFMPARASLRKPSLFPSVKAR